MPVSIAKRAVPKQLLIQILEQPGIVHAVQSLEAAVLHRWIEHVGLEDAGELVALASPEQLLSILDLDVWCSERAGVDETFDAARFALWVEVLLDSGVRGAVQKIAELDEDLLTLALCRHTFVIDVEELARRMSSGRYDEDEEGDPDLLLKELDGTLSQDFEQFRVIARSTQSWEPIRTLLVELDAAEPDLFVRLLERCTHISLEHIADNGGLYEVLSSGEMVDADVAAARDDRRSAQGYVAPSAAKAFLAHARVEPLEQLLASESADPITHAYFRGASSAAAVSPKAPSGTRLVVTEQSSARALIETLQKSEVLPRRPSTLLLSAEERGATAVIPSSSAPSERCCPTTQLRTRHVSTSWPTSPTSSSPGARHGTTRCETAMRRAPRSRFAIGESRSCSPMSVPRRVAPRSPRGFVTTAWLSSSASAGTSSAHVLRPDSQTPSS